LGRISPLHGFARTAFRPWLSDLRRAVPNVQLHQPVDSTAVDPSIDARWVLTLDRKG
jgi:hypothetical protein